MDYLHFLPCTWLVVLSVPSSELRCRTMCVAHFFGAASECQVFTCLVKGQHQCPLAFAQSSRDAHLGASKVFFEMRYIATTGQRVYRMRCICPVHHPAPLQPSNACTACSVADERAVWRTVHPATKSVVVDHALIPSSLFACNDLLLQ